MNPFTVVSPTCSLDGYGVSGEQMLLAAKREHGAEISLIEYDWVDPRFNDPEFLGMRVTEREGLRWPTCVVYFLPFALPRFQTPVTISWTMWETDRMPDVWAALVNQHSRGMIVPSAHCRDVFAERVEHSIEVVPYGTDTERYSYFDREERQSDPDEPFIFLMVGLLHYRKGVDFALRALREEFTAKENVQLWLKTRLHHLDIGDEQWAMDDPRVKIINFDYFPEEMVNLYHSADCFLAPSRGEGSGLTPRDAMSTGLPVVMTDWSGLHELADPRYGYPVSVEGLEVVPAENTSYAPGITGSSDLGRMARPSIRELRAQMRSVFEDRAAARRCGKRAADWMRREWTWERCSYRWLRAIEELAA